MKRQLIAALFASSCILTAGAAWAPTVQAAAGDIQIVADDIGGVVTSSKGPEAGVWVIVETKDLPTKYAKMVVTDDQGRYVVPELPKGKYKVWVRGYGLVNSKPVDATPGNRIDLTATIAPSAKEAAEYYPANYWYALLKPPAASEFPGTGPQGNGISPGMATQQHWLAHMKEQCLFCHELGDKATRELASGGSSVEAWAQRIQMARAEGDPVEGNHAKAFSATMQNNMARYGRDRGLKMFADWTDSIQKGTLPPEAPPRPQGVERNVVVTVWDWAEGHYIHDEATSDKRNPSVNANGPVYGTDTLNGHIEILDPKTNKTSEIDIPGTSPPNPHNPDNQVHNPMLDEKGRVWMSMIGGEGKPSDFCTNGDIDKFAKLYPNAGRVGTEIALYDPATKKVTMIPTCFATHHLNFGHDKDSTLFFSGDTNVMGWLDTKIWDETHDAQKSEGWCPMVLDTSGDGKITQDRTQWNSLNVTQGGAGEGANATAGQAAAFDPKKDTRINGFLYGMNVSPKDESLWYAKYGPSVPSGLVRLERGANPPETCKTEYWEPPKQADGTYAAFNARGVDLNSKGIAWVAFGSGQLARFDRAKCKVTNGPTATGQQCPEGWTFYNSPGPRVTGVASGSADWHYLTWVDLHDVLGLGKDIPIVPGSNSDSLLAFMPGTGKWVVLRVPYPMGFYTRGLDGRVDDPKAGWKGRGLWADYGEVPLWHQEGGEGSLGKMAKFQLRPDPLAH